MRLVDFANPLGPVELQTIPELSFDHPGSATVPPAGIEVLDVDLMAMAAKLLVTEVRRRASNQSTEEAALGIAEFLEVNSKSEEDSPGWMLLSALNILSAEGTAMCEVGMTYQY